MGFTPLYVARAAGAEHCAKVLEEAGGLEQMPVRPLPGYRSVLDTPPKAARQQRHLRRAVDELGKSLHRRPYVGQF